MMKQLAAFAFIATLTLAGSPEAGRVAGNQCHAAEFDIDSGRIILRRLQYCVDCGSALLVTDVPAGTMVRCPDCGREQQRLETRHLLTQLYQICRLCAGPLDPHGHHPGDVVECPVCRTKQPLTRDAFATGENAQGLGFAPGFPPGTGKKTLLLSPNRADARLTVVPLDESPGELPLPPRPTTLKPIPLPQDIPLPASRAATPPPPPEPESKSKSELKSEPTATPSPDRLAAAAPPAAPAPPPLREEAAAPGRAVDVPAVTADLFAENAGGAAATSGNIVARVNGMPIHARDLERFITPILTRLRQRAAPEDAAHIAARERELRREVLERLIDRELVLREAAALGYRPDPAAVRARENELAQTLAGTGADLRLEAERDVTMADMRRRYAEKPGSANPREVREFYRKHRDEMIRPRLIAIDQLVIYEDRSLRADRRRAEDIALEVSRSLEQGMRFDAMRERYDEFLPAAGLPHSEPALLPESAYARRVLAAGGDLRSGAVFGPVPQSGMLFFGKVAGERPAGPVPFEEAEKDIRLRLENEAAERNLDEWVKRLRNKAKIEIL